jgi:hypothetical protein
MLTYMYFGTNDLERSIAFYNATLGALGMRRVVTNDPAWDRVAAGGKPATAAHIGLDRRRTRFPGADRESRLDRFRLQADRRQQALRRSESRLAVRG